MSKIAYVDIYLVDGVVREGELVHVELWEGDYPRHLVVRKVLVMRNQI